MNFISLSLSLSPTVILYLHMILQKCRLATVLAAGDNQRRGRRVGKGKRGWGEAAGIHHLFVRYSLFTLCTIWWIIIGLSNAVPTNLLLLLRVCDICMYSFNRPCEYIHTCAYVIHSVIHAIALQGYVGIRKCIIANSIKRNKIKYDQYFKRIEKAICKRPL